jgi:hypothetical protein
MICYQVTAQFTFHAEPLGSRRPALVSTHIKKQKAKAFLVLARLPFGSRLKYSRFFHTKKEASGYVSYLHAVYKNRTIPNPTAMDGRCDQVHEFLQRKNSKLKISMEADFSAGQLSLF